MIMKLDAYELWIFVYWCIVIISLFLSTMATRGRGHFLQLRNDPEMMTKSFQN